MVSSALNPHPKRANEVGGDRLVHEPQGFREDRLSLQSSTGRLPCIFPSPVQAMRVTGRALTLAGGRSIREWRGDDSPPSWTDHCCTRQFGRILYHLYGLSLETWTLIMTDGYTKVVILPSCDHPSVSCCNI